MELLNDLMSVQVDLGTSMMVFATVLGVLYAGWMVVKKVASAVVGLLGRFPGTVLIPASIVAGAGMVGWGIDSMQQPTPPQKNSYQPFSNNELKEMALSFTCQTAEERTKRIQLVLDYSKNRDNNGWASIPLPVDPAREPALVEGNKPSGWSFIASGIGMFLCGVFGGIRRFCWPTFFEYEPEDGSEDA